jgi:glutathione S-transferase
MPERERGVKRELMRNRMQGQANHFSRYAPERIEYGVNRYVNETRRLYGVLNTHLEKSTSSYLVGDKCTIADIAHWGTFTGYLVDSPRISLNRRHMLTVFQDG